MRDAFRGERVVKARGQTYLPATQTMKDDGVDTNLNTPGGVAYTSYKVRAVFPSFVREAVEAMVGIMWSKPPVITLPEALEPIRVKATPQGENLNMLMRRVNEAQLAPGRIGILLDLPSEKTVDPRPFLATYETESIVNWDEARGRTTDNPDDSSVIDTGLVDTLNLVVLDETAFERTDDFDWAIQNKHRVLVLGEPDVNEPEGSGALYRMAVFGDQDNFNPEALHAPNIRGRTLSKIPFVFVNAKDIMPRPDDPPLYGLATLSMAVYRGEADYRQALFMQGQDTLVIEGGSSGEIKLGAGNSIEVPMGGSAQFVGPDSKGLPEMRAALENDKLRAAHMGAQLLDSRVARESGEALRVRVAAKTSTLTSVALTGAFAMEGILKTAAEWMGANPDQVAVTPNLDFAEAGPAGKELVEMMTARAQGAPLSLESIHEWLREREVTTKTFKEEQEAMAKEPAPMAPPGSPQGGPINVPREVQPDA